MPSILGIDLGGTKTAVARFDAKSLELQASQSFSTKDQKTWKQLCETLISIIEKVKSADTIAIGIGVAGLVNAQTGKILTMPNIDGSENQDLRSFVEQQTGVPTNITNDANAFALAEALSGSGKGESVVLGITLGTGVGGGIVIDGKIFNGAHGYAGEFGHMLLVPGKPPYQTDDQRGEVEQFLSGTAMGKRCESAQDPTHYLGGQVCEFMHPEIYREVAWLVTSLTHAFDPSIIVFGGSAGFALRPHLEEVKSELKKWMLPHTPLPRIEVTSLQNSGTLGAALLANS